MQTKKILEEPTTIESGLPTKKKEIVYSLKEFLASAAKLFGPEIQPESVVAAFRNAGKETATLAEAKRIVELFRKKEVK